MKQEEIRLLIEIITIKYMLISDALLLVAFTIFLNLIFIQTEFFMFISIMFCLIFLFSTIHGMKKIEQKDKEIKDMISKLKGGKINGNLIK